MAEKELILMIHGISCDSEIPDPPTLLKTLKAVNPYDRVKVLKLNDYFGTILHRLSARGYAESVKCVVDTVHKRWLVSFLTISDELGYTALHCAIFRGSNDIVRHILSPISYEEREQLLSIADKSGNTVLHSAVSYEKVDIIKTTLNLLQPYQRLSFLKVQNSNRMSPLDIGMSSSNEEIKACLMRYKKMSEPPKQQITYHEYVGHCGESMKKMMYDCSSEVSQKTLDRLTTCGISTKGVTSVRDLMGTAGQSKLSPRDNLEDLLKKYEQASSFFPEVSTLKTALDSVPFYDRLCLLKSHNSLGTALHCAVVNGYIEIALCMVNSFEPEQLLSLVKIHNGEGRTVLHECCCTVKEHVDVIKRILELLPDESEKILILEMQDREGYTALHCAANRDHSDIIKASLTSITDHDLRMRLLRLKNNDGATALDVARTQNFVESATCIEYYINMGNPGDFKGMTGNNMPAELRYAALEARMKTFVKWQSPYVIAPIISSLCKAGFYYTGHADIIRCFHCLEGFFGWTTTGEDPVATHEKHGDCGHSAGKAISGGEKNGYNLGHLCDQLDCKVEITQSLTSHSTPLDALKSILLNIRAYIAVFNDAVEETYTCSADMPDIKTLRLLLLTVKTGERLLALKSSNETGTILHCLSAKGLSKVLECLICSVDSDKVFSLLNMRDQYGGTLLHQAAYNGHTHIFDIVIEALVKQEEKYYLLNVRDPSGLNALEYAFLYWDFSPTNIGEDLLHSLIPLLGNDCQDKSIELKEISHEEDAHKDCETENESPATYPCDFFYQVIMKVVKEQRDDDLSSICENMPDDVKRVLPCLIQNEPLSSNQLRILSPLSDSYLMPHKQERSKKFAFVCYTTENRDGSLSEANYLSQSLQMAGFTLSKIHWSKFTDFHSKIQTEIQNIGAECSLLLVCIMCHGSQGLICGDDGYNGSVNTILDDVITDLPTYIPKVFIIQACQARIAPRNACGPVNSLSPFAPDNSSYHITLRHPNTALLISTVTGGKAVRGFYTYSIADYLSQADGVVDILGMHRAAVSLMKNHPDYKKCLQLPEYRDTLDKFLVLPPAVRRSNK